MAESSSADDIATRFFGEAFSRKIPASWKRFLWFMTCLGIACFSLIAGQGEQSWPSRQPEGLNGPQRMLVCICPLCHTLRWTPVHGCTLGSSVRRDLRSPDSADLLKAVQLLSTASLFILSSKVRSRALLFLYKLFFQLVYHVFYRNLVNEAALRRNRQLIARQFARLRSPSQFATVQLLSSISVVIIFPIQMTRLYHRALQLVIGYPSSWEDHVDNVATSFYCRGLAQNVTMVGFLGG